MPAQALKAYNEIVTCFQNAGNGLANLEEYIEETITAFLAEYTQDITERASNYHKVIGKDITNADTLFFNERRIVVGYKYLHEDAKFVHIVVALMKDLPRPNLSIRKAIFLYDAELQRIIQIENEIPEI